MNDRDLDRYVREAFGQMTNGIPHPTLEELTALVRNQISDSRRVELEGHLAACPECRNQMEDLREFLTECDRPPDPQVAPQWPDLQFRLRRRNTVKRMRQWGSIAAAVLVAAGLGWIGVRALRPPTDRLLAQAYQERRPFDWRLGGAAYGPIKTERGGASSFALPPSLLEAQARLAKELQSKPADTELLRLRAQTELLERQAGAAVETLQKCLENQPGNAPVLADLGVAFALRGDEEHQPADWASALEYLSQAIRLRPAPEWIFNQALVLERMQMYDQALERWREFLRLNDRGGWSDEARQHVVSLEERLKKKQGAVQGLIEDPERFLAQNAESVDAEAYLTRVAVSRWLPEAGTNPAARRALDELAGILQTRHGDRWLQDALQSSAPVEAWRALGNARGANLAGHSQEALAFAMEGQSNFDRAHNRAAILWTRLEETVALHNMIRSDECYAAADSLRDDLARFAYPFLRTRAAIEQAVCAMRLDRLGDAAPLLQSAIEASQRARLGETELRAGNMYLDCVRFTGLTSDVFTGADRLLRAFWSADSPFIQYQQIAFELNLLAAGEEQPHTALFFQRSALWAARLSSNVLVEGPAEAWLAVAAQAAGEKEEAGQHLKESGRLLSGVPSAYSVEPQLSLAEVELARGEPGAALRRLEALRSDLEAPVTLLIEIRYHALIGEASRRSGALTRASEEFRASVAKGAARIASLRSERERAGLMTAIEGSSRGLAAIALANSQERDALAHWKVLRALDGLGTMEIPQRGARTVLWCAELPDRYGCWLDGGDPSPVFHWLEPAKETLAAAVQRFRRECADPVSNTTLLHAHGTQIYQWLIAPFFKDLPPGQPLTFDFDGELTALPMEAIETPAGEYLGDRFALTASSGYGYHAPPETVPLRSHVLVVANPAVAGVGITRFPPLPESLREVNAVRAVFPGAKLLEGGAASADALTAALPRAEIVHFTGHAYTNAEGAALVLAPRAKTQDFELLRAQDLSRQNWSKCRLAVLAACATAAAKSHGTVNPGSLVRAITRSAAASVVASLWDVDSAATAEFMAGFYAALAQGATPSAALHGAERRVRQHREWAHPYYWAGFQLYGTI